MNGVYIGSYGRGTADSGIRDIETAFVLPADLCEKHLGQREGGPSALLQRVKKSIQNIYATSESFDYGHKIIISFREGISFRVLPVFETAKDSSWTHPNESGGGSWESCNPKVEIKAFNARDKTTNGNLRHLCCMMHVWRDTHKIPMSDLVIDTLAYRFIADFPHRTESFWFHDCMVRDFLLYLSEQAGNKSKWRVPGSGFAISRAGWFEERAYAAYELSLEAIKCNGANQNSLSRRKWREIFGPLYPLS